MQENTDNSLMLNVSEMDKDKKIEFLQALTEIFSSDSNEIERLEKAMILAKEYNVSLFDRNRLEGKNILPSIGVFSQLPQVNELPNIVIFGDPKEANLRGAELSRIKNVPTANIGVIGNFSTASTLKSAIEMQYDNEKEEHKRREMIQKHIVNQLIELPSYTHYPTRNERRAAQRRKKKK